MRSFHVPWRAGPRRTRAGGLGRMGRVALAVTVVLGLTLVNAAQHAASAATGAPYGGTRLGWVDVAPGETRVAVAAPGD